jgi:hypothetical protein
MTQRRGFAELSVTTAELSCQSEGHVQQNSKTTVAFWRTKNPPVAFNKSIYLTGG